MARKDADHTRELTREKHKRVDKYDRGEHDAHKRCTAQERIAPCQFLLENAEEQVGGNAEDEEKANDLGTRCKSG